MTVWDCELEPTTTWGKETLTVIDNAGVTVTIESPAEDVEIEVE